MQGFEVWIKKGRPNSDYRLSSELCVMMNVLTDAKEKSMKLCPPTQDEEAVSSSHILNLTHNSVTLKATYSLHFVIYYINFYDSFRELIFVMIDLCSRMDMWVAEDVIAENLVVDTKSMTKAHAVQDVQLIELRWVFTI